MASLANARSPEGTRKWQTMLKSQSKPMIHDAVVWCVEEEAEKLSPSASMSGAPVRPNESFIEQIQNEKRCGIIHQDATADDGTRFNHRAAIGIPVIRSGRVESVVVLFTECSESAAGAIEVWEPDAGRDELGLRGAVFSNLHRFAGISQFVKFPRGSGLPGRCWEDRKVMMVDRLGSSQEFMRSAGARAAGLDVGIAIPILKTEHVIQSVVLLLSSTNSPIAKVFEIWDLDESEETISLRATTNSECPTFSTAAKDIEYQPGEGIVGKTWAKASPLVCSEICAIDPQRTSSAGQDGISSAVSIPIFVGDRMKSIFVMFN